MQIQAGKQEEEAPMKIIASNRCFRLLFFPVLCCVVALSLLASTQAETKEDKTSPFPKGRFGKGRLSTIRSIPVLQAQGSPSEMGAQMGKLALRYARRLLSYPEEFLIEALGKEWLAKEMPVLIRNTRALEKNIPKRYLKELEAMAQASGFDRDALLWMNLFPDLVRPGGCSVLIGPTGEGREKRLLFGRNMDYPSLGYLHRYSLVTIYRSRGKHAFASIGFPGLIGVISGMNDSGLSLAMLEVLESGETGTKLNLKGLPRGLCFRRILEECTSVDEAEKLLRKLERTTTVNLAVANGTDAAIFEISPKTVARRNPGNGILCCTNHFLTPGLKMKEQPNRFTTLERYRRLSALSERELTVRTIRQSLHAAHATDPHQTLQTMIFDPGKRRLHLGFGKPPTSAQRLIDLDLKPLFQ